MDGNRTRDRRSPIDNPQFFDPTGISSEQGWCCLTTWLPPHDYRFLEIRYFQFFILFPSSFTMRWVGFEPTTCRLWVDNPEFCDPIGVKLVNQELLLYQLSYHRLHLTSIYNLFSNPRSVLLFPCSLIQTVERSLTFNYFCSIYNANIFCNINVIRNWKRSLAKTFIPVALGAKAQNPLPVWHFEDTELIACHAWI